MDLEPTSTSAHKATRRRSAGAACTSSCPYWMELLEVREQDARSGSFGRSGTLPGVLPLPSSTCYYGC